MKSILKAIDSLRGTAKIWALVIVVVISLVVGFMARGVFRPAPDDAGASSSVAAEKDKAPSWWTCSMHPQIRLPKPGLCPICSMPLIPLETQEGESGGLRELIVSENAKKLMEIQTAPVERKFVEAEVRMVGKIDYDETRLKYITAWVPGRLDRLFVDYTGVPVNKGDHMVSMYSPELLSAQEELIQAIEATKALSRSDSGIVRETTEATVEAAREKLHLLGLTAEQIARIEKTGKASDHVTIFAPIGGIVIHKNAQEGMYVNTGTRIYTIADLSEVWVRLDAYESDLMWLRYGQKVEFTTEAYPGERFVGTIAFIDPILTQMTRTVKVRVNAANPKMRLKPGMFVRAVAKAQIAAEGKVMDVALAGKWICPMHPDVVKETAGKCDICGMPLVRTESLGYVGLDVTQADKPLVIPVSAALVTGTRAVVYVEVPNREKPTFEGREIVLGPKAGDYYLVRHGLTEGERIVTKGNFKIDAELQIQAKPSMMTPAPEGKAGGHRHDKPATAPAISTEFRRQFTGVTQPYLAMQKALVKGDAKQAVDAAKKMTEAIASVDMKLLQGEDHMAWMKTSDQLKKILADVIQAEGIEPVRKEFALLSEEMAAAVKRFGIVGGSLYQLKCPMAFNNRGATWLQTDDQTRNPFFGAAMLQCGDVIQVLPGVEKTGGADE